ELDVHHRADHLHDLAVVVLRGRGLALGGHYFSASAPLTISINSLVMAAWRARLYSRESRPMISVAFLVAESIAVMRAPCSLASDSSSARHICTASWRGRRCSSTSRRLGS